MSLSAAGTPLPGVVVAYDRPSVPTVVVVNPSPVMANVNGPAGSLLAMLTVAFSGPAVFGVKVIVKLVVLPSVTGDVGWVTV